MNVITSTQLFMCAIISQAIASYELPSCVTVCKRNDPNLSKCWSSNFEKIKTCSTEFRKLDIPPFDPLMSQGNVTIQGLTYHMEFTNIEYNNTNNFKIIANTVDLELNRITLTLQFDKLNDIATIKANGSLLNFLIDTEKGGCVEGRADVTLFHTFTGKRTMKNGKEHIAFNDVHIEVRAKGFHKELYNCIVGFQFADKIFSFIINKHPNVFLPMYYKFVKETIGADIAKYVTRVYDIFPLDILHPVP